MRSLKWVVVAALWAVCLALLSCGRTGAEQVTRPALERLETPLETVVWQEMEKGPSGRSNHAVAYDSARKRLVLFGGYGGGFLDDTWEWDGVRWMRMTPTTRPPARYGHALAYDAGRERVVLFGGNSGEALRDVWEWDGTSWTNVTPATGGPSPRSYLALTYDSVRQRVLLFGGLGANAFGDTWEWDGNAREWTNVTPSTSPSPRYRHALAYDDTRGKVVLFGGTGGTASSDTWEWDGVTRAWTKLTPPSSPPAREQHALVFDPWRGVIVLFGGSAASEYLDDTWAWDGTNWSNRTPGDPRWRPPSRAGHALAYDEQNERVLVVGGFSGSGAALGDTWQWNGEMWTAAGTPEARSAHALTYDSERGTALLFGGKASAELGDTWERNGTAWVNVTPDVSPLARSAHALAYDSARDRAVLFGGSSAAAGYLDDTWEWNGGTKSWGLRPSNASPPARRGHALAYDSARGKAVLFGGVGATLFADTWEWDGITWTDVTPGSSPLSRQGHALAYDSARERVVLFGGLMGTTPLGDTWEWDGSAWVNATPSTSPPARSGHSLAYDSARKRVVLFGGSASLDDTWEWDGTSWTDVTPAPSPSGRSGHRIVYDEARGRVVLFGGMIGDSALDDTWEYHAFGGGCSTDDQCNTGYCIDGVCCDSVCGGGDLSDCVACSVAAGAETDGICGPLTATACGEPGAGLACFHGACVDRCATTECPSDDPCQVGSCDSLTGECVFDNAPDGTACDDGDPNTVNDICGGGLCAGMNLCADVTCVAKDQCHVPGSCDPLTGECTDPLAADDTSCDDGNACTEGDTCQAGACIGGAPLVCPAPLACQEAATCEPSVGCVYAPKAAGTLCRAGVCENGQSLSAGECDGSHADCPEAIVESCGLFLCGPDACLSSCSSSAECIADTFCDEGICKEKPSEFCLVQGDGAVCDEGEGCSVGICFHGVCEKTHKLSGSPCEGGICIAGKCMLDREPPPEEPSLDEGEGGGEEEADGGAPVESDAGAPIEGGAGEEEAAGGDEREEPSGLWGCRAAPGRGHGGDAAWVGLGLFAATMWRRSRARGPNFAPRR